MAAEVSWKDLILDSIPDNPGRAPRRSVGINFPEDLQKYIRDAARQRDMSMASFVRRSALAVAAYDLSIEWDDISVTEPSIRRFDGTYSEDREGARQGRGHGPWSIRSMGEIGGANYTGGRE